MDRSNVEEVVKRGDSDAVVAAAIEAVPFAMVLTDPRQDDNPITYVNTAFEDITLYSRSFAVGRNCRFLQGDATDGGQVDAIRDAVATGRDVTVDVVNYKADGTRFLNRLLISPICDDDDAVIAYVGIQREMDGPIHDEDRVFQAAAARPVEDTMLLEVQHRVKNHLAMLVSLIRMQAANDVSRQSFEALSHRVRSLALLYDELSVGGVGRSGDETVAAGAYLGRICTSLAAIEGRGSIRVNVDCDEMALPVDLTGRLGLLLTEFLTNALEHAFDGRDRGVIRVRFERLSAGGARLTIEDDGVGLPEGSNWPWDAQARPAGTGSDEDAGDDDAGDGSAAGDALSSGLGGSLVLSLARSMEAEIAVRSGASGTIVTIDVPRVGDGVGDGAAAGDGPA